MSRVLVDGFVINLIDTGPCRLFISGAGREQPVTLYRPRRASASFLPSPAIKKLIKGFKDKERARPDRVKKKLASQVSATAISTSWTGRLVRTKLTKGKAPSPDPGTAASRCTLCILVVCHEGQRVAKGRLPQSNILPNDASHNLVAFSSMAWNIGSAGPETN